MEHYSKGLEGKYGMFKKRGGTVVANRRDAFRFRKPSLIRLSTDPSARVTRA